MKAGMVLLLPHRIEPSHEWSRATPPVLTLLAAASLNRGRTHHAIRPIVATRQVGAVNPPGPNTVVHAMCAEFIHYPLGLLSKLVLRDHVLVLAPGYLRPVAPDVLGEHVGTLCLRECPIVGALHADLNLSRQPLLTGDACWVVHRSPPYLSPTAPHNTHAATVASRNFVSISHLLLVLAPATLLPLGAFVKGCICGIDRLLRGG